MYQVLVPYFTRSEYGPLQPLFKVASQPPFDTMLTLKQMDLRSAKELRLFSWRNLDVVASIKSDMVLCGFDRPEMAEYALHVYHKLRTPIAQIFAGDLAGGAHDDRDRFVISNYADLLFCAGTPQYKRVARAVGWRSEVGDAPQMHLVGATHYDDMNLVEPYYDKGEYDLVLYNPPSLATREDVIEELDLITYKLGKRKASSYWVAPNGDKNSDLVWKYMRAWSQPLADMPREEFLGWLKHAKRFIGNSSCMFYEAPYFRVRTEHVGMRNMFRDPMPTDECKPGASHQILKKIVEYLTTGVKR